VPEPYVSMLDMCSLPGRYFNMLPDYLLIMDFSSQSSSTSRDLGEQHNGHSPRDPNKYLKAHKT